MTTQRHVEFHFHFSWRSIRAPAPVLRVHHPSLSLLISLSLYLSLSLSLFLLLCSRLMQWMSTVCRSSPMVCWLPVWKVESVSARLYSGWVGWLNAESLSNSPRISECAYTPAPLFTYANEYGSMPLIRILDPASFASCSTPSKDIRLSVYLSVYLIVGLSVCPASAWFFTHPDSNCHLSLSTSVCTLLSQFSDRGYLVRLR